MENKAFKYYAFISYSHIDQKIAKKLQKRLQSYHLPSNLLKSNPNLPKNLKPVFIDESNLVAVGTLKEALYENLNRSNYLIVICSPSSAKSEYVNDEVKYFIDKGRADHIVPLIVEGEPHAKDISMECFPPAILNLPKDQELLGIDIKKFGETDAFLRVIAALLRLDIDNFIDEEKRRKRKNIITFSFSAAVLSVLIGIFIWNYIDFFYVRNDPMIQYNLGYNYENGLGVPQNYIKAREWYEKAAIQNLPEAQYAIGYMYYEGLGVEQNYYKAKEWYEKAANQNFDDAQYMLGNMYYKGLGVEQNYYKAKEWYEKAADQNLDDAQYNLAIMYYYGLGVMQDYNKARELLERSAIQGNVDAQHVLLYMHNMYE